nr:hypothetical protein [Tanacetum cinerariifolium]
MTELDGKIIKEEKEAVKRIKGREEMKKVDRGIMMINHTLAEAIGILTNILCQVRVTTIIAKTAKSDSDDEEEYQIKRNKFGAPLYGPKHAPFLNCNDLADRSLALQAVTNPFCKISVWKKATMGTHDDEVKSSRSKFSRQYETVEEVLLPQVNHEFLLWEGCSRESKSRYSTRLANLLSRHIYSPCVMNWDVLNKMGCDGEIDDMLRIRLREARFDEEIVTSFNSKIARKSRVLTEDVLRSLSAPVYRKDLDTTTLRELIDSEIRLIPEDPQPGVPRVGIPRPPKASMQDLYDSNSFGRKNYGDLIVGGESSNIEGSWKSSRLNQELVYCWAKVKLDQPTAGVEESVVGPEKMVCREHYLEFVSCLNETPQEGTVSPGSESRPPMLNKENYVPWSSRLLRYAKSRPNRKLIPNSILNGPYVRRMIPEPGDAERDVNVNETFHEQTDDELSERELKQIEADDQAIQTILLGLPEDIYAAVDSCETAQEIWLRVQQTMKGSDNSGEEGQTKDLHTADYTQLYDFLKYNQKEVDELKAERIAKIQDPLALMANSNNPYSSPAPHQDLSLFNQNYLQQPMPNPEDIIDSITAMNMALSLMAKAFKLNYSTPTNNNQRISSNLRNRQIAQPGMNMGQDRQMQMIGGNGGNQFRQYAGNLNRYNALQNVENQVAQNLRVQNVGNQIKCYNCRGLGHFARDCTVRPRRRDTAYLQTQLLIAQKEEAGIQLQAKEYDLMATAADLDKIEEVNANCILMANLQKASSSGTQTDSTPVYNTNGSGE